MSDRGKIIKVLREQHLFCLTAHVLPDGDSIGSLLALGEALSRAGKDVKLFSPGIVPKKYTFLRGSDKIATAGMELQPDTVVIALDSSDPERLGTFAETAKQARCLINIDHHVTNVRYGTLNLVDPEAAATGEIIYGLLTDMGQSLTASMAEALYVAISTDTGSFKYDNTTPTTHRAAAALLEHQINPAVIAQRVFDERPLSYYMLLKEALATLELHGDNRIALITISKDMLERSGTTVEDIDGIVNYTRDIEGVELGILIYVESAEEVKVGFRSRRVDVSLLAQKFNGGGHARAAGCRIHGAYGTAKEEILLQAQKLLQQTEGKEG